MPTWWPLPVLGVAGVLIALTIVRLPGRGGHEPTAGLGSPAPTRPIDLPGVLLAALASIGLGMVLGPEAPRIALGTGLAVLSIQLVRKDAPDQVRGLMAAAGSFAAISSLFGSPVFIGMGSLTGLSSSAYAIAPLSLPDYAQPDVSAFAWTIVLAVAAVVVFFIIELGRRTQGFVKKRALVVIPIAALLVAGLAIAFGQITGESADLVLLSGQDSMGPIVDQATSLSVSTLALLILFKGLAYGLSLGSARGGPTFPAMFLGIVAASSPRICPGSLRPPRSPR